MLLVGVHGVAPRDLHGGSLLPSVTVAGIEVQSNCLCHSSCTSLQKQSGQKKQPLLQHTLKCLFCAISNAILYPGTEKEEGWSRHLIANSSDWSAGLMLLFQSRQISGNTARLVTLVN